AIRHAVGIEHALRADVGWRSAFEVDDPAQLPAFEGAGDHARALAEQHLSGTDGQCKTAVGAELMPDVARLQRVVRSPINGIRIRTISAQEFAPGVGSLQIDTGSRAKRRLELERIVIGVAEIRLQGRGAELRIRLDEVLREIVITQHRTLNQGRNRWKSRV